MKRLVYSPRAYAFCKTERHGIVNLSNYITAGRVERKVGMVSSAELTLRNPQKVFTRGVSTRQGPYFHPMDPITIWLERIRGYPVQVFSGYLDVTPYLQLYPGTVQLEASCTLKRLLHTYWDPALPFSRDFLKEYGWITGDSGNIINLTAEQQDLLKHTVRGENKDGDQLDDGSIGNLLFAVLKHIVEWDPKHIHIEQLPSELLKQVTDIFEVYNEDAILIRKQLEGFIKRYIGDGSYGEGGTNSDAGPLEGGSNPEKAFNYLRDRGLSAEQAAGAVGSMMGESGRDLDPTISEASGGGGYGIAQWTDSSRKGPLLAKPNHDTLAVQLDYVWEELNQNGRLYLKQIKSKTSVESACEWWTLEYERPADPWGSMDKRKAYARSVYNSFKNNDSDRSIQPQTGSPVAGASASAASRGGANADTEKIFSPIPGVQPGAYSSPFGEPNHGSPPHTHMGLDVPTPTGTNCVAPCDGTIGKQTTTSWSEGGMIHFIFDHDVGQIKAGTVIGWGHTTNITVKAGDKVKGGQVLGKSNHPAPHVHFIQRKDQAASDGQVDPAPLLNALLKGETAPTTGGDDTGAPGGSTNFQDILSTAKATAFVQDLEYPSIAETIEALALTGPKSLLNDKPVMPFIEQLTGASMRQFQSLPNGDFFAFYPDYFGHMNHRKPYWNISDIEILDGGIQLTDEALATHVFGVGDTSMATPGIGQFERMMSTGVISIFNVWQSGFTPQFQSKTEGQDRSERRKMVASDPTEVINFLKKYGARPHVEEAPFIRSPFFEAFMAYQTFNLMWSRLFLTNFQFTFMPELFPGGLVGLPEHGLQLYIDGVTHSFDYEAGFTTEAALSAPASLDAKKLGQDPLSFGLVRAAVSK